MKCFYEGLALYPLHVQRIKGLTMRLLLVLHLFPFEVPFPIWRGKKILGEGRDGVLERTLWFDLLPSFYMEKAIKQ